MLHQIINPKPTPIVLPDNLPPTPPPPSTIAAMKRKETYNNRLSEHDNRNIIQNFGEYFGRGFGKRLMPQSGRRDTKWILCHDPLPTHPDRSVTRRDYRGLPPLDDLRLSAPLMPSSNKKSSGEWMASCYDDWGRNSEYITKSLIYRDDAKRMPIHPWHY